MDLERAITAAAYSERLPGQCKLKDQLDAAGGCERWLSRRRPLSPSPVVPPRWPEQVRALGYDEAAYPPLLRELDQPPLSLFVRGGPLPDRSRCVAIIGSRRCSDSGRWVARDIAEELAEDGIVVISGLAFGIDAAAHEGALCGGRTLAVLASPVDQPTPERHRGLAADILAAGGWLVSERAPDARLRAHDFPKRNRLVAALCSLVLVIEAGVRSGTLHTVRQALALQVEVGAVPGLVTSPVCIGSNRMLQRGAHVITSARDVLEILGRQPAQQELPLTPEPAARGPEVGGGIARGLVVTAALVDPSA